MDGEGPLLGIEAPKRGQAVYTAQPEIRISFQDFYSAVDPASLQVTLSDQDGHSTDVTGELTITADHAQGTLSTPLTEDTRYVLNVSLADTAGNVSQSAANFYVPIDPASIVAPAETEGAGWVSGTVYDSSACDDHLTTCEGLAGARVTLTYAGSGFPDTGPGDEIAGTVVTGPDGFFAFPLAETNTYWLRVDKAHYTYAQRDVEVIREHSTATNAIYLTPLDSALTLCDSEGCSHASSDGLLELEIPAGAIAAGQTIEVTATNFSNVEFLPSGELPPGTWETYAFNLGGNSEVSFQSPITVKLQNYRGFEPGEEIPLGYWNQTRQAWEHEGFGVVDASGDWVVMSVTHFSNYDCNAMGPVPPIPDPDQDPPGGGGSGGGDDPGPCSDGERGCFIDYKSGTFTEEHTLPSVPVLGREVAPRLAYNSRRAHPGAVIDLSLTVQPQAALLDYMQIELFIEGQKTDTLTVSITPGIEHRYRYFWDGRDSQGRRMPPGVYAYRVKQSVPYRTQYYRGYYFGGRFNPRRPMGVYVTGTLDYWTHGTLTLTGELDSPFGDGWALAGQQRLHEDEAGRIVISDGEQSAEFYFSAKNLLQQNSQHDTLVWTNSTGATVQALPEKLARAWDGSQIEHIQSIDVAGTPYTLTISNDGKLVYVASNDGEAMPVINLNAGQVMDAVTVKYNPAGVALSPDGRFAYVVHLGSNELALVDLAQRSTVDTIPLGGAGWAALAVSADGAYAYVVSRFYNDELVVVDLHDRAVLRRIFIGNNPNDIALSPDGTLAYVINEADTLAVVDLEHWRLEETIQVGHSPNFLALAPDGNTAYVTNESGETISVVDLERRVEVDTIPVGAGPQDIVITSDGTIAYVANEGESTISVVDLSARQEIHTIPAGSNPIGIALSNTAVPQSFSRSANDRSWLEYDNAGQCYTRHYPDGTAVHFNPDGTHDFSRDRHGNTTRYSYNPDGTTASMSITPAGASEARWVWTFSYQNGKLAEIVDPAGRATTFTIDGHNHLTTITGPLAPPDTAEAMTRRFSYDARGLMTHETDEAGNTTTHQYDDYGRITQVVNSPRAIYDSDSGQTGGGQDTLTIQPQDTSTPLLNDSQIGTPDAPAAAPPTAADVTARVDYGRGSKQGRLDKWGRWLEKTDADGTMHYQRDAAGNLLQRRYPDGSCDEYRYDRSSGKLLSSHRMDAAQCALDPADRDPEQIQSTWYTYEARFQQLKTKTDSLGNITTYIYDYEEEAGEAGNLIRIESPQVEDETGALVTPATQYSYNAWGLISSETDARGSVTRYVYTQGTADEAADGATPRFAPGVTPVPGLLTQVIRDEGGANQTTTYSDFDAAGHALTVTGPGCCGNGQITHYTYDLSGRPLTKTNALGIVTKYEYNVAGQVSRQIEDYTADGTTGRNVLTEYRYDSQGRVVQERTLAGGIAYTTSRTYDINGKLATQTDARGQTTTYRYTDTDRLESVTDPLNQTTRYTYTEKGELETTTLPNGTVNRSVYNDLGQTIREIEDEGGLNLTTRYSYDRTGNLDTLTDPDNVATCYDYDALNRRTSETQDCGGLNLTTRYRYDAAGNLRFLTDAEQHTTEFVYDAQNRLRREIRPMSEATEYDYDTAGNLEEKRDANGQRTEYDYNAADLLEEIRYVDSAGTLQRVTTFSYDRVGHLSGYNDGTTSAVYTYDALNRKISETVNYPGFSKTFSYSYTADGRKQTFIAPDGSAYEYAYHDDNSLKSLRIPGLGSISSPTYTMGRPDRVDFPGGHSQTFSYDALLRLEQMTSGASGPNAAYTYDNVSNILTKSTDHGSYTYGYDDVSRLTSADNPVLADEGYTYDGVGNRATASGVNGTIVHTANNELTVYGELEYDYDANGNLVQKRLGSAAVNYVYDAANRLVQVEDDVTQVVIAEYGYDPFGRRLWKEVGGTRTYFLYADEGLIAEYDHYGTERRSYGWQPDSTWTTDPLWLKENGEYYWYQNDHLGTPQQLIDSTGTIVWSAHYTAFGKARVQVEAITNNLRFPGQYYDAETGLHYNFHRYYDPEIGRYTKVDPIGFGGRDVNLYRFVQSNPIISIDPYGLKGTYTVNVGKIDILIGHYSETPDLIKVPEGAGATINCCHSHGGVDRIAGKRAPKKIEPAAFPGSQYQKAPFRKRMSPEILINRTEADIEAAKNYARNHLCKKKKCDHQSPLIAIEVICFGELASPPPTPTPFAGQPEITEPLYIGDAHYLCEKGPIEVPCQ